MSQLKYKTRGQSTPRDKSRVYFTSHPKDFAAFFETITGEILKLQDCAIWYDDDYALDERGELDEQRKVDLSQMQLFVMPVTTRLLATENRAIDEELAYALEHHIPVLPLMQESGLDELYAKKFGDLHYLDKHKNELDLTARSYEEKLNEYLERVLIGDELRAKIRREFDAYIFMSYRKVDRKYALELMRLIHENKACRDIAIWYDEYLIPGEDFNKEIEDAMEKSKLISFVVTPNFIVEGNYVMQVEYPNAKASGKPILPVEMTATDHDELSRLYDGIGEPSLPEVARLGERICERLDSAALGARDELEHLYLIGLAYLSGVDVEVDSARAVGLIRTAADAGYEDAMDKLADMYDRGDGVERDYDAAVEWRQRIADMWRERYEAEQSEDNGWRYAGGLHKFFMALRKVGKLDSAIEVGVQEVEVCEKLLEFNKSTRNRSELASSYNNLGSLYDSQSRYGEAEEMFRRSLELFEEVNAEVGTLESRSDLAMSYNNLGSLYYSQSRYGEAEEMYRRSLELREKVNAEVGTVESRSDLAMSYNNLGSLYDSQSRYGEAEEMYRRSIELREEVNAEVGTVKSRSDLASSYNNLGYLYDSQSRYGEAEEMYRRSIELKEEVNAEVRTLESRSDLARSYHNLGNLYYDINKYDEAIEYVRKGSLMRAQLFNELKITEYRRYLSVSYNDLAFMLNSLGHLDEAEEYLIKCAKLREELHTELGTADTLKSLTKTYNRLIDLYTTTDQPDKAAVYRRKLAELTEES